MNLNNFKTKKPTYKDLAFVLSVSESAIKQYNPIKRRLMINGLWLENEIKYNKKGNNMEFKARLHKVVESDNGKFKDRLGNRVDSLETEFVFYSESDVPEIIKDACSSSVRGSLSYEYSLIGFGDQFVKIDYGQTDDSRYYITVDYKGSISSSGSIFGNSFDELIPQLPDMLS